MCFKAVRHRRPNERKANQKKRNITIDEQHQHHAVCEFLFCKLFCFSGFALITLLCLHLHAIDTFVQWSHRESAKIRIRHAFVIVTHSADPSVSALLAATRMAMCKERTRYSRVVSRATWLKKVSSTIDRTSLHLRIVYSASSSAPPTKDHSQQTQTFIHPIVRLDRPKGLCEPLHVLVHSNAEANAWTELYN